MNAHTDTHPDAEAVQIESLRRVSVSQRVALMRSMTRMAVSSSRRACRRAHPELTERELDLLFVELNYGSDLAERLRRRLTS